MNNEWEDSLVRLKKDIQDGLKIIKAGSLPDIAELRYKLAVWRAYVGGKYAEFDTEYANEKLKELERMDRPSVAYAETVADSLPIAVKRTSAKELLETLNQLGNACASAISAGAKEQAIS